ncbi:glycogen/starch/alpha-glucan phosphorylase [Colwellia sp. 6M3]|jgi:starch phosphorylase|uniref:glycogen/starch/alpha-glucan phosphorylase n=1 Tax=Colwellia sp. 6M3 TaxID=2759849 RepID=UPI0015F4F331|nr:glycogen/starch/alpha-glucan phosphorylase [Colwellia sp. 6M3]MBA6416425.1 glycogen/starch/alpha-glucan phosphorylase [Colwellia sp. 6M3]
MITKTKTSNKTLSATNKSAPQLSVADISQRIKHHLKFTQSDQINCDKKSAYWRATSLALNDIIVDKLQSTKARQQHSEVKSVNYLSLEYLMGRLLSNNLHNLDLYTPTQVALKQMGFDLADLCEQGADLALGNGGLGRLAACFLDSLATLDYNAMGYGVHYQHGLFKQSFVDGQQIETPDMWREFGSPWEICRPESSQNIALYGYVEDVAQTDGTTKPLWHAGKTLKGVPWDVPIVGYNCETVNTLRLWECRADSAFDWELLNQGDYLQAHQQQVSAETVSKVLYPNDEHDAGKELRFIQQYFFCACSVQDIIARFENQYGSISDKNHWSTFCEKVAIQLNDTHPTVAILELMRTLIDNHNIDWDNAWAICQKVFAYTNHTLLPEALEKWSVSLFQRVLPRHLSILYRINEAFLNNEVNALWPNNDDMRARLSLIEEGHEPKVRMAHLCVVTAHKVNGVAKIHSDLVKQDLFPEFNQLWPTKLTNVTNGITPRRWLKACNPLLANLLDNTIEGDWAKNLNSLSQLAALADDADFQKAFMTIKQQNKIALTKEIKTLTGVTVSPDAIFDVQIKRLHEYKRQHLNLLHIISLYRQLLENPELDMQPRVFIFGAKAAPSYQLAKEIIYATNKIADKVNNDERIQDKLKVIFLPNYRVSLAEKIIPASDVSEQISTAGKEASGTGNMKLALNGAVTIGTLDGANIEIAEEVGNENIFIFGLTVDEVKALDAKGYNPYHYYENNAEIRACLDWLDTDYFTPGKPGELSAIKNCFLAGGDPYKVLADFQSYANAHKALGIAYKDRQKWAKMAILNTALMGKFNSDRSIEDYVKNIWHLTPSKSSELI